mmetsp:Transcript_19701/g.28112  ORF Transcript_19701/g.28112 Transcript_19701/m.28112 type:complete len:385 (+) Transcript_19701:98-1252(+)|eukprot:CAMPEP_0172423774 /NCGR_PEP_ID=MMETSP1064-20121228/17729_1 /TAXON_ID=202472 /ORGANISM="Aulacoseira subarctica , Strain CCAP 1002/5" /LENGTH=384 /DNA_ID=CAMNT_0013165307 /DNA_START=77 /DNA_END=1231 /DNA_ORIENTATION=+
MPEETDIRKMKVSELRAALEKRGLNSDGLKAELINRLQQRLDEEEFGLETNFGTATTATIAPTPEVTQPEKITATTKILSSTKAATTTIKVDKKASPPLEEQSDDATPIHNNVTATTSDEKDTTATWEIDTTPEDTDDALLAKLEEEIKKAKRLGIPTKELVKRKQEILKKKTVPIANQEGGTDRNKRSKNTDHQKKADEGVKNDRTDRHNKDKSTGQKQSKADGDKNLKRGSGVNSAPPEKKQRSERQAAKQTDKLNELSTEELQKRLDRANKFGSDPSAIEAAMKKKQEGSKTKVPPLTVNVDGLTLPELQKHLKRAKKFESEDSTVEKIQEAIAKKSLNDLESLSKDELQKRLDRALKYNSDPAIIDKIKTVMRKFRFGQP